MRSDQVLLLSVLGVLFFVPAETLVAQDAPAQEWWLRAPTARTKYYALKSDLAPDETRELAQHMDATCEEYFATFSQLPVRLRRPAALGLFLFANEQDYQQTLANRFQVDGTGSWGMCISRGNNIALVGFRGSKPIEEMKPLLQHEGFHQFARHLFPDIPRWADEGLAEVFERGVVAGDRLVLGEISEHDRQQLIQAIESKQTIPLAQLMILDGNQWLEQVHSGEANMQYLQAWSLVHFFLFADQGKYQKNFLSFLVQLNANTDWEKAFVAAFGWPNTNQMEQCWMKYVQETPATDIRATVRRLDFLAAGMLHLRDQKVFPASFEELETELSKTDFEHTATWYGKKSVLSAKNQENYRLPGHAGDPSEDPIRFCLVDRRGRPPKRNYQSLRSPEPLNIMTMEQSLNNLMVRWRKSGSTYVPSISVISGR